MVKVFRLTHKHLLIVCLILLDFFLLLDIASIKNTNSVLGQTTQVTKPQNKLIKVRIVRLSPTPSGPTPYQGRTLTKRDQGPTLTKTLDLLQQINNYRAGKGLSAFSARSETCFFANIRSQEIISAFNHDGFKSRVDSKTLPYPSYSEVAENIAQNSDPNGVVPAWINSPGHNENLLKNLPFACVVKNGNNYVFEAWSP